MSPKKIGLGVSVLGVAILIGTVMGNQGSTSPQYAQSQPTEQSCDPSYPDFCIPPYSADIDCRQIPYQNFHVMPPDRHGFDQDHDGIGCER